MSQWFDMWSVENLSEKAEIQLDKLRESVMEILDLLQTEATLICPDRMILGGISQGCATAIHTLLYGGVQLGGFVGLSSWLPFEPEITNTIADNMTRGTVEKRLVYSRKLLNARMEKRQHQSTSTLVPILYLIPQCLYHTAKTMTLCLFSTERSYPGHWRNSVW